MPRGRGLAPPRAAIRGVTPFTAALPVVVTSGLRTGGGGFLVQAWLERRDRRGSNGAARVRTGPDACGRWGLLVGSLQSRHRPPPGACAAASPAVPPKTTDAAPPPQWTTLRRVAGLVAASCAAPRWLCVQPRSVLPRSREAHGCAVRSRDTAPAPHMWRKWLWLALPGLSFSLFRSKCDGGKDDSLRATACSTNLPVFLDTLCTHRHTPLPRRTIQPVRPETRKSSRGARAGAATMSQVSRAVNCDFRCCRYDRPAASRNAGTLRRRSISHSPDRSHAPDSHGARLPRARPRGRDPRWRPRDRVRPCESGWRGWFVPATVRRAA